MSAKIELNELFNAVLAEFGPETAEHPAMESLKSAISKMLSDGYVRKELYKEKLSETGELKESLETALAGLSTAGTELSEYREKLAEARETHEAYVRNQSDAALREKTRTAVADQLKADGADPRYINILMKELDLDAAEIGMDEDGTVNIANYGELVEPLKTALPEAFGVFVTNGARIGRFTGTADPCVNPWDKGSESLEGQTALYRQDPALARELARSAGVKLR